MKTITSQQPANIGFYVSMNPPDVCFVGSDGEALDGRPGAQYSRVPTLLVLAMSPVLGGVFALAFPLLVVVGVVMAVSTFVAGKIGALASENAYLVRTGWEPATAYLNKKTAKDAEGAAKKDEAIAKLDEEVQARRADEKGNTPHA